MTLTKASAELDGATSGARQAKQDGTKVIDGLLAHRVLMLLGKGGVGKTLVSAALASHAVVLGRRTLVMEADERAPLAALFGRKVSYTPAEIKPGLSAMVLDGKHALEEYLRLVVPGRAVLNAIFSSKLYQYFVQAAPGLRELMMLGKIYYETREEGRTPRRWDVLIFDGPASGHALTLLKMPLAAQDTFGQSVVGKEARNISAMLHARASCTIALVTTPEPMALSETLETYAELQKMKLNVGAIILNRYSVRDFTTREIERFFRHVASASEFKHRDYHRALVEKELSRAERASEALAALKKVARCPLLELPEHRGVSGSALLKQMVEDLADAQPAVAQ